MTLPYLVFHKLKRKGLSMALDMYANGNHLHYTHTHTYTHREIAYIMTLPNISG